MAAGAFVSAAPPGRPAINAATYERHLATLASDEFEGRKPGSAGERKTLAYLERELRRLGLKPGHRGSFLQTVPLVDLTAASDTRLQLRGAGGAGAALEFAYGRDVVVWTKRVVPREGLVDSPLVFVGYGVVAPEYQWNDYAGVDMRGKTAVVLVNDPGWDRDDPQLFRGRAMTYYGRWTYKFEEAMRQGAAGALIVHEERAAAYPWETVVNSWTGPQIDMDAADGHRSRIAVEGWLSLEAARRLFAAAGESYEELKRRAGQRGFRPVPLPLTASVQLNNVIRRSTSANVIAWLPGRKRPGEYIVYSAHWDHLGRTLQKSGDSIFNGAVDNATGTAALLTLAEAFRKQRPRPQRSIVFLAVTAEESGLLGSAYYVANPPFPLAQTVANINMDGLPFGGPTRDVAVVGYGASELEDYLAVAARAQGRVIVPEDAPERGAFYRSDHFNFAKAGVPALFAKMGIDDRERGKEWGRSQVEEYVAQRYHKPSDEYRKGTDLRGALEDIELLFAVGLQLANETAWPNWRPDNEFRATRDRSRALMPK
ncbi:MAG: M28 family metallopeptidase [Steroidobacteraceae bacterium]|nr:M28 family metallopeptidase [Steroidobacteraceae bacterium]MDW8258007.1 M28 family metallopeptidase [Gammaproteobacteria bacterium]